MLTFEGANDPVHAATVKTLRNMGHDVKLRARQGSAHSIQVVAAGIFLGAADSRRGGLAAGFSNGPG